MQADFERVDRASPVYQEFARLYRIARDLRPSGVDRWNGELSARTDDKWGGFQQDGSMRLSRDLVLAHLSGAADGRNPRVQAQALATVLHESGHAGAVLDAPHEPNAVRSRESRLLDEGLVECRAVEDFRLFAERAGYHGLVLDGHEYEAAVEASDQLVAYAAEGERQNELRRSAINQPVVMRWDAIANEVVNSKLGDVVPQDPRHQQAARAELVNAMVHPGWQNLSSRPAEAGRLAAHDSAARLDAAVGRIRQHYSDTPGQPYPAVAPNRHAAAGLSGEQARAMNSAGRGPEGVGVDSAQGQRSEPGRRTLAPGQVVVPALDPALRAALSGQSPPSGAVRYAPNLGDGARGRAGGPGHESGRTLNTPPERGD